MDNETRYGELTKCPNCDRVFRSDDPRVVYCSSICKTRYNAKTRTPQIKKPENGVEGGEFLKACEVCMTVFHTNSKQAKYCSRSCKQSANNKKQYQKKKA